MRVYKWIIIVSIGLILLGVSLPNGESFEQRHEVSGEVLDENNKPVPSVEVKIYRQNEKLDETHTDGTGRYKVTFLKGKPIDTLSYYHTAYNPATVDGLAGERDHKISKTLYSLGSKLSKSARLEVIASLQKSMTIDLAHKVPANQVIMKYSQSVKSIGATVSLAPGPYFELNTKESDIRLMYK